jgi:hypothetical protein
LQNKYAVIVFRKTGLDNARHIAFSQQLGDKLEVNPFFYGKENDRLGEPFLFDVAKFVKFQLILAVATDNVFQYRTRWLSCEAEQPPLASQYRQCPLAHRKPCSFVSALTDHVSFSNRYLL